MDLPSADYVAAIFDHQVTVDFVMGRIEQQFGLPVTVAPALVASSDFATVPAGLVCKQDWVPSALPLYCCGICY